jgi:hypothetical protein
MRKNKILTNYIVIIKTVVFEKTLLGLYFNSFLRFGPRASMSISDVYSPSKFEIITGNPQVLSSGSATFPI